MQTSNETNETSVRTIALHWEGIYQLILLCSNEILHILSSKMFFTQTGTIKYQQTLDKLTFI